MRRNIQHRPFKGAPKNSPFRESFHIRRRPTGTLRRILPSGTTIFGGALKYFFASLFLLGFFVIGSIEPRPKACRNCFDVNFKGVEIRDFLKVMTGHLRRNILIDESVKGKITIVSYQKVPRSRALEFLRQVLEVKGYAVIDDGDFIKVMPAAKARVASLPKEDIKKGQYGVVSRVVKLPAQVNVSEVANVVRKVAGKDTSVVMYRPTNTLVVTGYARNVRRALAIVEDILGGLDAESQQGATDTIHLYHARHMTAESLAQVLVRLENPKLVGSAKKKGKGAIKQRPGGKIKAVAHKESNTIIVTATSAEWAEIRSILNSLDSPRHQILLEVLIAEISSSKLNDFGIDWRSAKKNEPYAQFNTGMAAEGNLIDAKTGKITGNNTLNGFSLGFLEKNGDLLAILNANIKNTNFNVISSPQILTLDNQEAEINVGQDVPVRTQQRTSGGGTSEATVNSFEYRPSGIKLKFTPHVSYEEKIGLDMFTEITTIEDAQTPGDNPRFNKRNVKTYVTVKNKQTIVIGGLVSSDELDSVSKIPLLGDIPLIGHLFRRSSKNRRRTNLMIFITPHILDKQEDSDRITQYKSGVQSKISRERHNEIILWPQQPKKGSREEELKKLDEDI